MVGQTISHYNILEKLGGAEALFRRKVGKTRLFQGWGSDRFRSFTTGKPEELISEVDMNFRIMNGPVLGNRSSLEEVVYKRSEHPRLKSAVTRQSVAPSTLGRLFCPLWNFDALRRLG